MKPLSEVRLRRKVKGLRNENAALRNRIAELEWQQSGLEAQVEYLADTVDGLMNERES